MTFNDLININVVNDPEQLNLKTDCVERATSVSRLGEDKVWSSTMFYKHLELLDSLVPLANEAGARTRIDAFFFRVSAMVPPDKHLILNLEQVIPQTVVHDPSSTALAGVADYTAVIANSESQARFYRYTPAIRSLETSLPGGFFVTEAKSNLVALGEQIPQAIGEMYACLNRLKQRSLRGALSNGQEWIFIILVLNSNGDGARYKHFSPLKAGLPQIGDTWPNLVTGILSHWIEHSFTNIGTDDWFEV